MAVCQRSAIFNLGRRVTTHLQTRSFALKYKQPLEEARAYGKFRRDVSLLRKQFREEWLKQQEIQQQALNAQSVEQARLEKMVEQKALEENKQDLERMAKKRELREAIRAEQVTKKKEEGDKARREWESKIYQRRSAEVLKVQAEAKSYVTFENLDLKINEMIEKPAEYNSALNLNRSKDMK